MLNGMSEPGTLARWPDNRVMLHFCEPVQVTESEQDRKLLQGAEQFEIPFEGRVLQGYCWGVGKKILLVHGWESRASHLAFIARSLAKAGFQAVAFDGPAHGRSRRAAGDSRSSLPEFCRAIYHIARGLGTVHGIIGHSFGATAAAFSAAGQANIAGYRVPVDKLALISCPAGIDAMIRYYCEKQGYPRAAIKEVTRLLEQEFPLTVADYQVADALGTFDGGILVVHDQDDKEVAVADAEQMVAGHQHVRFVLTKGEGHRRILASRSLLRAIKSFFSEF